MRVASAQQGDRTWTDGGTIFLAADPLPAETLRQVSVQAALLAAGSLAPEITSRLGRRAGLARRYLTVEAHRTLTLPDLLLPPSLGSLADRAIAARSNSPAESLEIALSREELPEPLDTFGDLHPRRIRATPPVSAAGHDGAHLPRARREHGLADIDESDSFADSADAGEDPVVDFLSSPVGGGGVIGRLLKRLLGDARSPSGGPAGADAPTHRSRGSRAVGASAFASGMANVAGDEIVPARSAAVYPEWDERLGRYRLSWCTVIDADPAPPADAVPLPVGSQALRRSLGSLGIELETCHRQPEGDDLDLDAVVELRVDLAAGSAADGAVYIDSLRRRRDLAVLVLLDVSGSAGEPSVSGVPVHHHQRAAAAALAIALHQLGDRVALYAFRSMGRSAVTVQALKRFDERMGMPVLTRLGSVEPGAYTRLGAAVRHGAAVLRDEGGMSRRLLVVLSDGFAYDHGYERSYGEADTRRALHECRRQGIGCLCLSIGSSTDADALRRVFGTAAHAQVTGVDQLPRVAAPLFRAALRVGGGPAPGSPAGRARSRRRQGERWSA